ncbi:hypothetical protein ABT033_37820 [Streptomyces pharetrae]|uniref:hypothetical protein n=1 Tax=Streptomyces pharetrae TaxID=291370 RepID=UPI003353BF50
MPTFSHGRGRAETRLPATPDTSPTAPHTVPTAPEPRPTAAPAVHALLSVGTGGGKATALRHLIGSAAAAGWSVTASDGKAGAARDGGRTA